MARFLVLPFRILSPLPRAGSRLICARVLTAGEPATGQAVMVSQFSSYEDMKARD